MQYSTTVNKVPKSILTRFISNTGMQGAMSFVFMLSIPDALKQPYVLKFLLAVPFL